jgi:hypothetical protein
MLQSDLKSLIIIREINRHVAKRSHKPHNPKKLEGDTQTAGETQMETQIIR